MVIDFHTHVFPAWVLEKRGRQLDQDRTFLTLYSNNKATLVTAKELLENMDQEDVAVSAMVNLGWERHELCVETNSYLLEMASRNPYRLVAFCSVNPLAGEEAVKEVERCAKAGARGIGELHPDTQGYSLADQSVMQPVMDAVQRNNLVLLTHASEPVGHEYAGKGSTTPDLLLRFITAFPKARVVCAHWGGGLPFYSLMPEVKESLQNVYFDTASSPFLYTPQVFSIAAQLVGARRILFGTDYPLIKPSRLRSYLEEAGLPMEWMERILGENARTLLRV